MRRIDRVDFSGLFDVFITIKSNYFLQYHVPIWPSEKMVCDLVREEARDRLLPFVRDRADKKIKREIFNRHFEVVKGAEFNRKTGGWDNLQSRDIFFDAIVEGYGFFYGDDFIESFFEETSIISGSINNSEYKSLEDMLSKSSTHGLIYQSTKDGAFGRFLRKGYISAS